MAEAMATISLVSNITQFIIFGSMVVKRVNEFKNSVNDVPKVFRDIKIELPLLLDTLERTKEQAELGIISDETQSALLPVVDGCNVQVRLLEEMLSKVLASSEDSSWQRSRKALTRQVFFVFVSLLNDREYSPSSIASLGALFFAHLPLSSNNPSQDGRTLTGRNSIVLP